MLDFILDWLSGVVVVQPVAATMTNKWRIITEIFSCFFNVCMALNLL